MDLPLEDFFLPAAVINISHKKEEDLKITLDDLQEYEKTHGKIPEKCIILGCSGWSTKFWKQPERYGNPYSDGIAKFPVFHNNVAYLLLERNIAGIGMDTICPDQPEEHFIHKTLLPAGKIIIENLTNLEKMPSRGLLFSALQLK